MAVKPRTTVENAPVSEVVGTLSTGQKVKRRTLRMRACNERDAKDKLCCGHLKRWFGYGDELRKLAGDNPEVYRCERCKTLYLPNLNEEKRTEILSF